MTYEKSRYAIMESASNGTSSLEKRISALEARCEFLETYVEGQRKIWKQAAERNGK